MKTYTVYFQLFGKKMKTNVFANGPLESQEQVKSRLQFDQVIEHGDHFTEAEKLIKELIDLFENKTSVPFNKKP